MVAARVAEHGIDPAAIGGELWTRRGADESLCYAGANLIPLRGAPTDMHAFADKAMGAARRCSSLVGRAELVLPMWRRLEHAWGPARDVREHQPLMAMAARPSGPIDAGVRRVRIDELDAVPGGRDRHVHRRGRHRPAARRRRPRLPPAGRRADRGRPGVGAVRARQGDLQGRGRVAVAGGRSDPGRLGASRIGGVTGSAPREPRRWSRPSSTAAGSRACTSTTSTPSPGRPMRASDSPQVGTFATVLLGLSDRAARPSVGRQRLVARALNHTRQWALNLAGSCRRGARCASAHLRP